MGARTAHSGLLSGAVAGVTALCTCAGCTLALIAGLDFAVALTHGTLLGFSAKLHPGLSGPFVLLEFPAEVDTPVVYLETRTDGLYLEEDHETAEYTHVFDHLRAAARSQKETIELMQELQNNQ